MRESRLTQWIRLPTHYYTTFGLALYDEQVHIKVLKVMPTSRIWSWISRKKPKVEEYALQMPYARIHRLHELISTQTETYFNRKKRRLYAQATRELDQFVHETRCIKV